MPSELSRVSCTEISKPILSSAAHILSTTACTPASIARGSFLAAPSASRTWYPLCDQWTISAIFREGISGSWPKNKSASVATGACANLSFPFFAAASGCHRIGFARFCGNAISIIRAIKCYASWEELRDFRRPRHTVITRPTTYVQDHRWSALLYCYTSLRKKAERLAQQNCLQDFLTITRRF